MASKRKSTTPCMIPVKAMKDEVEPEMPCLTKDGAFSSRDDTYGNQGLDLSDASRHESGDTPKDAGTYMCRPCNFETPDLNLFLDHVYSGHPEFRSDPSFHCVDCGVTAAKFEGLALHNARVHPSTVATTLQLRKRDRKVSVEQNLIHSPNNSLVSSGGKEAEISITKTPIMRMLKGKSEPKRIVVSHSATTDELRLDTGTSVVGVISKQAEKKEPATVTVTHVPTIVHNGATNKVTLPSAIQIVNGSGALPILKTAVTQVVSVVPNRGHHQQAAPITVSSSSSSSVLSSTKNLPKVMIPLSSIPTYNSSMDNSSFLKTSFSKFPYPTKAELCYLTVVTKYPEEQIKIWFTAQRLKQGISWSPEEIEEARRKMFNTIIQAAPSSGQHQQQHQTTAARQAHHSTAQQTITVLPASLATSGIPHLLQGSLMGQGGVIVQPVMANGIQVSSAPMALAVTPKPQSATKPMMQARPAAALVADKGVSMVVGTVGSSSSLNYTLSSSSSGLGVVASNSSSSSNSRSSSSSNISSLSSALAGVISTVRGPTTNTLTTSSSSSNGKTGSGVINMSTSASSASKSSNSTKSTESGKSAVNGKGATTSAMSPKASQDAKGSTNGKEKNSSNSSVKKGNDGKASPDIKTSTVVKNKTDVKADSKSDELKSNGPSLTSEAASSNTTTTSASTTAVAVATTTTTSGHSNSNNEDNSSGSCSDNKSGDAVVVATKASASPSTSSTSSSRTPPSASLLDPNLKGNKKSQEQLSALKQSFLINQFPDQDEVTRLTSMTGLSVREVRKWFSDRRYHFRNLKGPRTSSGGQASDKSDKSASPAPGSGSVAASSGSTESSATSSSTAERPKTPVSSTPVSPPPSQQQQTTTSPTTPSRRPPRPPSPDFTAIRYKEREPHQLVALEASFSVDPDPSSEEVDRLRQETKMTRREIHGWFAERRKRAAVEKKKAEAEKAEKEEGDTGTGEGEKSGSTKDEQEKMDTEEQSGQCSKDGKQKEDAPKVNPIKINLKMLKVTESSGKEDEGNQTSQAENNPKPPLLAPPSTSPIPIPSTPYRGKKTPDQLHVLKQAFARTQWPGSPQYDELIARTGLPRPEVVRWFGDCRYVLKNGQLKWLESYQTMVEEEDFPKANLDPLKVHLEEQGKLDESQTKDLARASGLTEDLVRRWFTNRAPLLLAAKKVAAEVEEDRVAAVAVVAASAPTTTKTTEAEATASEVVKVETEPKAAGSSPESVTQPEPEGVSEEPMEESPSAASNSTASSHESASQIMEEARLTSPNQGAAGDEPERP